VRATKSGRYSLRFAARIVVDKYTDHGPLAGRVRILSRYGVHTTTQTLWDRPWAVNQELFPTYDRLYEVVMTEPVIGLDQSSWPRLESKVTLAPSLGRKHRVLCSQESESEMEPTRSEARTTCSFTGGSGNSPPALRRCRRDHPSPSPIDRSRSRPRSGSG
jgi:hypothetical protein